MNASEIRAMRGDKDGYEDSRNRQDDFWLSEIALQITEANQLARLWLRLRLAEESIYSPAMRADIVSEVREELEKS
jgi:hypothetical protein